MSVPRLFSQLHIERCRMRLPHTLESRSLAIQKAVVTGRRGGGRRGAQGGPSVHALHHPPPPSLCRPGPSKLHDEEVRH